MKDRGKDRYGRTVARVSCSGIDANTEQLRRGMAWVFTRYLLWARRSTSWRLTRGCGSSACGPMRGQSRRGGGVPLDGKN